MTTDHDDSRPERLQEALGSRVRSEFEQVAPEAAERLRVMRRVAVNQLERQQPSRREIGWLAGGLAGSAASVALVVALVLPGQRPPGPAVPEQPFPELSGDELAVVQSMEVLEELEFLAWMEEEANRAPAG